MFLVVHKLHLREIQNCSTKCIQNFNVIIIIIIYSICNALYFRLRNSKCDRFKQKQELVSLKRKQHSVRRKIKEKVIVIVTAKSAEGFFKEVGF